MPALLAPLWRWLDGGSLHPKAKLATLEPRASPTRSMRVIGAGPGRTGTASLKQALEQLGFAPCYHMFECSQLGHADRWVRALAGDTSEFEQIFDVYGFQATVDFPASVAFGELLHRYPDAKVILTSRDPRKWATSVKDTIWSTYAGERSMVLAPWKRPFQRMCTAYRSRFWFDAVGGTDQQLESDDALVAAFEAWAAHVKATVPPEKLLVFESRDGWEPLCAFLGVPVPTTPFPNVNDGAAMKAFMRARWRRYACFEVLLGCAGMIALRLALGRLRRK